MSVHAIVCLSCDVCGKKSKEYEAELGVDPRNPRQPRVEVRPLPPGWKAQLIYSPYNARVGHVCPSCSPHDEQVRQGLI